MSCYAGPAKKILRPPARARPHGTIGHHFQTTGHNVDELYRRQLTRADRVAIAAARVIGSWGFVVGQAVFLAGWFALNLVGSL